MIFGVICVFLDGLAGLCVLVGMFGGGIGGWGVFGIFLWGIFGIFGIGTEIRLVSISIFSIAIFVVRYPIQS